MSEFYYTQIMPKNEHVWALTINNEANIYELLAIKEVPNYYRFVAMPTFIDILGKCAGMQQYTGNAAQN